MKILSILLALFLLYGCSDHTVQNQTTQTFDISLSPALAGNFPTLIPVNSQLIVYTTKPLDYTTVDEQTVYIKNLTDNTLPAVSVESLLTTTAKAIVIRPVTHLMPNNDYELVVSTAVATDTGEHRSSDAVITFTTGAQLDTTAPVLISTLPDGGSTAYLESYGIISFQFNEPLSPLSISTVEINVKEDGAFTGPGIDGELKLSGSLLSFIPNENFVQGKNYRVELNTTNIMDLAGNRYTAQTIESLYFSVTPAQDATPIDDFIGTSDYNLSVTINTLESSQNELFVGTSSGFDIFTYDNTASPTKLVHRSHLEDDQLGTVYSISLDTANQRVYLGTSTGFSAVDISDLNQTNIISHLDTLNTNGYYVPVYGLDFDQQHLYLAASSLGVIDVNISNILAPTILQAGITKAPTFDINIMDANNLALSSYGNGLSSIDRNTLVETDLSQESIYSHNLFNRLTANNTNNFYFSAGSRGVGNAEDTGTSLNFRYQQAEAYVTRVIDRGDKSVAIVKDLGLGFFSTNGNFYQYYDLIFKPTAITYIENKTALGNDMLVIADRSGQLYLQVMN